MIIIGIKTFSIIRRSYCQDFKSAAMRYLNVAEKNDAAKNIAAILSRGNSNRREGFSNFNKIYEFTATVLGQPAQMIMTSVSGHLLNYEFVPAFKNWQSVSPLALFDAPLIKNCPENYVNIKRTLEREIRSCSGLIIWTDCDREGENIGFEVIKVCKDIKPNIQIYRAKFSEITAASVFRALNNLGRPNKNISDAVDVRQELDLRTGAAFTRLQTLRLQKVFPQKLADKLISYGSCQFPTLGFVVERYKAIEQFISEQFWKIKMNHKKDDLTVEYNWKRDRLFDKNACEAILDICEENETASVENIESKPKNKWRPLPLDTVEFEKNASRKLKINAKDAMKIAEKLYTQGFISYPRTETNIFPKELNLTTLVEQQTVDNRWGQFAQRILNEGGPHPRQGRKSDQAHPPIHPIKYTNTLTGNDQIVYEFIVRHFLACVSKDAVGHETVVHVDIANEKFIAKGLMILEKNYLDVYVYEKWNAKEIHIYQIGETFTPTELAMVESSTNPPKLLTEADLIALMEKHGIGTDATHAEHIDTIKSREYVGLHENIYFVPGTLGMGLVEGYNNIGLEVSLAKPNLRAEFENDLKLISEGRKDPDTVRREQIEKYKAVFRTVMEKMNEIDKSLAERLNDRPVEIVETNNINQEEYKPIMQCPKCGNDLILKTRRNGAGKFITCTTYPTCKNSIWFPLAIETVDVTDEDCQTCGPNVKKLKIKFKQNMFPGEPNPNILCIGGCDMNVLETLEITPSAVREVSLNPQLSNPNPRAPLTAVRQNQNVGSSLRTSNILNNSLSNNRNSTGNVVATFPNNNGWFGQSQSQRSSNDSSSSVSRGRSSYLLPKPSGSSTSIGSSNMNSSISSSGGTRVVCQCGEEAVLLTVRKEGPNKGRQFYKCKRGKDGGGCDHFSWAEETQNLPSSSTNVVTTANIKCQCNTPATLRTVSKDGPNKGRQFYCCSKPMGQGCSFFKWMDEVNDGNGNDNDGDDDDRWGGGGGGGVMNTSATFKAASNWKKNKNTKTKPYSKSSSKRKCGLCRQEGHSRNKCPNG